MKVYIVLAGNYSDCHIEKVYLNEDKAKEYCEWCKGAYIEEFDTVDDNLHQAIFYYKVYIRYEIETNDIGMYFNKCCLENPRDSINVTYGYLTSNHYIFTTKYIPASQWKNEEHHRSKYTKMMQDIAGEIKYYLSEGYTIQQIDEMLNEKIEEE